MKKPKFTEVDYFLILLCNFSFILYFCLINSGLRKLIVTFLT
jgi:hypothetical protein